MKKVPTISLCLITRDEEERLERCLNSVRGHVQDIVVVDTGSMDRTIEIAESAGARVFSIPWDDDFSAPRNRSMKEASGDWLLFLDADETLTPELGIELREVVQRKNCIGGFIPLRDFGDRGRETVSLLFRLVRNRSDVRWRYRLHEQILPDVNRIIRKEGASIATLKSEIHHDGYQQAVMEAKGKRDRNRRLYEAQLKETPDDIYMLYKYADFIRKIPGEELNSTAALEHAYARLKKLSVSERRDLPYGGEICALYGLALDAVNRRNEAIDVLEWGRAHCRETADLLYVHGTCLLVLGRPAEAEAAFRGCQGYHGRAHLIPAQPQITGAGASLGLARALMLQNRPAEAADAAFAAVGTNVTTPEAIDLWVDAELKARNWSTAMSRLIERVRIVPTCAQTWLRGGDLLTQLRLFDKALPWLARAAELLGDDTRGHAQMLEGACFLALGHHEHALSSYSRGGTHRGCRAGLLVMSLAYDVATASPEDIDDRALVSDAERLVALLLASGESKLLARLRTNAPFLFAPTLMVTTF